MIRYTRPLVPSDVSTTTSAGQPVDKAIPTTAGVNTYIVWALGSINQATGMPGFHGIGFSRDDGNDVTLDFGRTAVDNCPPLVENEAPVAPVAAPVAPVATPITPFHRQIVGDDVTWIDAHIGPAGGPRGYTAITDGLEPYGDYAWYLDGQLVPEVYLRRGTTYQFRVNGGTDNPLYLTNSPYGGYSQLSPAERAAEEVYAGVTATWWDSNGGVTNYVANGNGPLCLYEPTTASAGAQLSTYEEYFATLDSSCSSDTWLLNQGGIVEFTPDQWTPDVIYYQSVNFYNLGYKIYVIDANAPAVTSEPTSAPNVATSPPTAAVPAPTAAVPAPTPAGNGGGEIPDLDDATFQLLELEGQLAGSNLRFKFNSQDARANGQNTISIVLEIPTLAWAGWAVSDNGGFMVGSEAVIGLPDTGEVLKYNLNAKSGAGVVPMPDNQQTLIDASIVQDSEKTVLSFTKILEEEGEIPINFEDDNTFLSAWGSSNNLGIHSARASFTLEGAALETRKQNLWKVHGWLASMAWTVFSPLAIAASILRRFFPGEGLWFQIHRGLNMTVVTFTLAAFIVAYLAINQETPDGADAGHFDSGLSSGHRTLGLVIFILAIAQATGGILRPHAPHKPADHDEHVEQHNGGKQLDGESPDEESPKPVTAHAVAVKSKVRFFWEVGHRAVGLGLLCLCWYQVKLGIEAYSDIFKGGDTGALLAAFYAIAGTFAVVILVGYGIRMVSP